MTKTVVLIEPLLRGSRLQIVANFLSALAGQAKVVLVTRKDYASEHFSELIVDAGLTPHIETVDSDLGGAWMRNLTSDEYALFVTRMAAIARDLETCGQSASFVFMALDDYLAAYLRHALVLRKITRAHELYCVKYRVEYLFKLNPGLRLRSFVLRVLTSMALGLSMARLVTFDERLQPGRRIAGVLPDPWFGDFSPRQREQGRRMLGLADDAFVLLSLGKQDRRKGFDFILSLLPELMRDQGVVLAIVGRIDKAFVQAFDLAKRSHPGRIVHIDAFVPESDLPAYFASADAFLLPYSQDFTATSGTLCRAAASGVPVLSTAHGLVGYRVRQEGLGATFDFGDAASFMSGVELLRAANEGERAMRAGRAADFASRMSLPVFERAVRRFLRIDS